MKKITKRTVFAVALLLVILFAHAALSTTGTAEHAEKRILVVETTDMHGYILDASVGKEDRFEYRLACIAHRIDMLRASGEYDDIILLDGGDLYQGTPVSLMTGGAVMRAAMDAMHYDAVVLGNHDFDWGVSEYAADQEGTIPPYELGNDFGDAKIPVLAPDLFDAATGERVPFTRDYAIIEKAGLRIAVVGYIPDYSHTIMKAMIDPYRIDGNLSSLNALVQTINDTEHPDATIVLAHEDPVSLTRNLDPDQVDLVCGGHSHKIRADVAKNGIPYIQGYCNCDGFASAVLVIGSDGTAYVEDLQYTSVAENRADLYETPENTAHLNREIMEFTHAGWDAIRDEMSEVLGYIDTPIQKEDAVGANSAGNWVTGLYLRATQDQGTVMAFYNNGGIRSSFTLPYWKTTREITVYDIYRISPFGNSLLVYEINGKELARLLADGLKAPNYGDQMSGLTFTYAATGDDSIDRAKREYTILSITLDDGTEVDINDTETLYRVCTTSYNATLPHSVFSGKEPLIPEADAPIDNEAMIRLLREESLVNDGYIPVDTSPRGIEKR